MMKDFSSYPIFHFQENRIEIGKTEEKQTLLKKELKQECKPTFFTCVPTLQQDWLFIMKNWFLKRLKLLFIFVYFFKGKK